MAGLCYPTTGMVEDEGKVEDDDDVDDVDDDDDHWQ